MRKNVVYSDPDFDSYVDKVLAIVNNARAGASARYKAMESDAYAYRRAHPGMSMEKAEAVCLKPDWGFIDEMISKHQLKPVPDHSTVSLFYALMEIESIFFSASTLELDVDDPEMPIRMMMCVEYFSDAELEKEAEYIYNRRRVNYESRICDILRMHDDGAQREIEENASAWIEEIEARQKSLVGR